WVVTLIRAWASDGSTVAGIGLIGLFPTGAPQRTAERWVLRIVAATAALLPVLFLLTNPPAPEGGFPGNTEPAITSPLFVSALRPAGPAVAGLYYTFAAWTVLSVIMLYLRYRRSSADSRRRIRWLLAGAL